MDDAGSGCVRGDMILHFMSRQIARPIEVVSAALERIRRLSSETPSLRGPGLPR